ncbi:MAG: DegT/DnrJ/EryC1/StrS family aminotransferase [Terriglobales bacterium]
MTMQQQGVQLFETTDSSGKPAEIPFHRAALGDEEVHAVAEVIRSGWLAMGPLTIEFERAFAQYVGTKHAVAVSSCTAALHLALEAAGIGAGDEVLIPSITFTATAEAVIYLGARPVLVDVRPDTMNLDPVDAARRITPRTRAIIPVHFAGQPCDMQEIHALAKRHGLHVVEDAAHALPSEYHGKRVGVLSAFTAFSFYATKTLTTGEGGMVTTDNDIAAARMRMMRLHGIGRDAWKRYQSDGSWHYEVLEAGFKYNFTDLQAALGLVQLRKCDELREARRKIAASYLNAFRTFDCFTLPEELSDRTTSWHLFVLRLQLKKLNIERSEFIRQLKERGIGTSVHFIPLHLHPFYQREYGCRSGDLPAAEKEYERCLSLPIYPTMSEREVAAVISAVSEVAEDGRRQTVSVHGEQL